jgi:peptidoglycan/xylan/chitin deacetylase (PgdA/CDA1 family)
MLNKKIEPTILLTFDVEEFDLPLEYHQSIDAATQMEIGFRGVENISTLLKEQAVPTTLFVTGAFAQQFPAAIASLSQTHEIASHALYHSSFKKEDLLQSKLVLEGITQQRVTGFRMPRLRPVPMQWLRESGYAYDASINPTYIPGRYNHFSLPRTVYTEEAMLRLPCSVSPRLRIPLFWLSFKNLPYPIFKQLALQTLKKDGYLSLYFHPWEFTDISQYKIPFYVKKQSSGLLLEKMNRFIIDLKRYAAFSTIQQFLKER